MTTEDIEQVVGYFAEGARRAREAGADGIELHGANGYLFTQFLSSAINDRDDQYGGSLENRARFAREVVRAIRKKVGPDFHLQYKISATEYANSLFPWRNKGNTIDDTVQVMKWLEEDGVDAVHVSNGSSFPHPHNPGGGFPPNANAVYDVMIRSCGCSRARCRRRAGPSGWCAPPAATSARRSAVIARTTAGSASRATTCSPGTGPSTSCRTSAWAPMPETA
jgi:2,4-dienoyl-CoA reductase-like NADH-dependent reductase (Old Yellow Enzyme family)